MKFTLKIKTWENYFAARILQDGKEVTKLPFQSGSSWHYEAYRKLESLGYKPTSIKVLKDPKEEKNRRIVQRFGRKPVEA